MSNERSNDAASAECETDAQIRRVVSGIPVADGSPTVKSSVLNRIHRRRRLERAARAGTAVAALLAIGIAFNGFTRSREQATDHTAPISQPDGVQRNWNLDTSDALALAAPAPVDPLDWSAENRDALLLSLQGLHKEHE